MEFITGFAGEKFGEGVRAHFGYENIWFRTIWNSSPESPDGGLGVRTHIDFERIWFSHNLKFIARF